MLVQLRKASHYSFGEMRISSAPRPTGTRKKADHIMIPWSASGFGDIVDEMGVSARNRRGHLHGQFKSRVLEHFERF